MSLPSWPDVPLVLVRAPRLVLDPSSSTAASAAILTLSASYPNGPRRFLPILLGSASHPPAIGFLVAGVGGSSHLGSARSSQARSACWRPLGTAIRPSVAALFSGGVRELGIPVSDISVGVRARPGRPPLSRAPLFKLA